MSSQISMPINIKNLKFSVKLSFMLITTQLFSFDHLINIIIIHCTLYILLFILLYYHQYQFIITLLLLNLFFGFIFIYSLPSITKYMFNWNNK